MPMIMKWKVGTKLSVGFGLVLLVFVAVGIISYWSTARLIAASEARKRTYDVLSQVEGALSLMKDLENGQRSFVITGEESYLEPYKTALSQIDQSFQSLRQLTEDN